MSFHNSAAHRQLATLRFDARRRLLRAESSENDSDWSWGWSLLMLLGIAACVAAYAL